MQPKHESRDKKERKDRASTDRVKDVLSKLSSGNTSVRGLSAAAAVEDFLAHGLLPVPETLVQVSPDESIGSVVGQMYQCCLRSCIVAFSDGRKEFFDCMDLASFILEVVGEGDCHAPRADSTLVQSKDWEMTKRKLRQVAQAPVGDAVRGRRGASEFRRLDAEGSLMELLRLFSSLKRVPVYRHGELCRVVTPSDILEMCCCVSEDSAECLEATLLTEMMQVCPGILSGIQVSEDSSFSEVLQDLRDSNVDVAPVIEASGRLAAPRDSVRPSTLCTSQDLASEIGTRSLVGQFDTAALRVMLVHLDATEGTWWWEDSSLTRNIFLEPCMDYLSLSGTIIVSSGDEAPFHTMKAEETLARCITKVLTSNYQSVVVYPGDSAVSARGERKVLSGTISTLSLLVAMLNGGLFEVLRFKPSQPRPDSPSRREPTSPQGGGKRRRARTKTLTKHCIPDILDEECVEERHTKVKFCPTIEVDNLDVPTCPEHGVHYLNFVQDGEGKYPLDFYALRDMADGSQVVGAAVHCNRCSRPLGRLRLRAIPVPTSPTTASSGFFDLAFSDSGYWVFELPFLRRSEESGGLPSSSTPAAPSALKRGTRVPHKKSKTMERLDAIRAQHEAKTSEPSMAPSKSFLGMCCSPCRIVNGKDQIRASGMSIMNPSEQDLGDISP